MTLLVTDLTGANPDYRVEMDLFRITKADQKITFREPVFGASITIVDQASPPNSYGRPAEWTWEPEDIDETAIAKAQVADQSFTETLVRAITWKGTVSSAFTIALTYQKLYPVESRFRIGAGGTVNLTPGLVYDMVDRINNLELVLSGGSLSVVPTEINPRLLPLDIQKEATDTNVVTGEVHRIDVFSNVALIQPLHGAFFRDSLTIIDPVDGNHLQEGVDWTVRGLHRGFMRETRNASGIYTLIHVTREMVGDLEISYHAVGGDVSVDSVREITTTLNDISSFLGQRSYLTASGLVRAAPFISLNQTLQRLEAQVRNLSTTGGASYADATHGTSVRRTLTTRDTALHWWSIAELFKVDGATEIFTADRLRFRIQIPTFQLMADVNVAVDLGLDYNNFVLSVDNAVQNLGYELFSDTATANANTICYPQFRVIWNRDGTTGADDTGAYLQMGLNLPGTTAIVSIEDRSGVESTWKLVPAASQPEDHADTAVTLPDGTSTWTPGAAGSHVETRMMPSRTPYLVWQGSSALNTWDHDNAQATRLPAHFRIEDIRLIEVVVQSGATTYVYPIRVPMLSQDVNIVTGRAEPSRTGTTVTDDLRVTLGRAANAISLYIGPESGNVLASSISGHLVKYVLAHV